MWVRRTIVCVLLGLSLLTLVVGLAAYRAVGTFPIAIPAAPPGNQPGTLVAVERTGKYPAFVVQYILNSAELPEPIAVDHGITLYRVRYRTTNRDGGIVVASGLVALPNAGVWNSVVVYHHGTNAQRHTAPSQNGSSEGLLVAAAAAGAGACSAGAGLHRSRRKPGDAPLYAHPDDRLDLHRFSARGPGVGEALARPVADGLVPDRIFARRACHFRGAKGTRSGCTTRDLTCRPRHPSRVPSTCGR